MAYRIRYGEDESHRMSGFWIRCLVSIGIGAIVLLGSVCSEKFSEQASTRLGTHQIREDESALKDMAKMIATGEGWYASAVAYCREVMELS